MSEFAKLVTRLATDALAGRVPAREALAELARLGRREASGPAQFTRTEVDAAIRDYRKKNWGLGGKGSVEALTCADPMAHPLTQMGHLVSVTYETSKGGDPRQTHYEHEFSRPLPVLAYSKGGLVICGGRYRVENRGIVD